MRNNSSLPKYGNQWILNCLGIDIWGENLGRPASAAMKEIQRSVACIHTPKMFWYHSPVNFQSNGKKWKQNGHIFSWSTLLWTKEMTHNSTNAFQSSCDLLSHLGFPHWWCNLFKKLEKLSMVNRRLKLWGCSLFVFFHSNNAATISFHKYFFFS